MAYTSILVTNGVEIKKVPLGFSWTTFFFGGIPALFRQDWLWGVCLCAGNILLWGFPGVIASFFYNKVYAKALFARGFYVHSIEPDVIAAGLEDVFNDNLKKYLGLLTLPEKKLTTAV